MGSLVRWILPLLLALSAGTSGQNSVTQELQFASVMEGDPVQFNCSYGGTQYSLQWYKQQPGGQFQFVALMSMTGRENHGHFTISLDTRKKTSSLTLMSTWLNDSAVYFCAMSSGNALGSLIFGSGTKLVVLPDLENSEPSVYELQQKKETEDTIKACLVTDYFPSPVSVGFSETGTKDVNGSIVVVKESEDDKGTASYGTVVWSSNETECVVSFNGKDIEPREAESESTCSEETIIADARMNLLSLTVLGLRVILLKAVAFSGLLTFHTWSS